MQQTYRLSHSHLWGHITYCNWCSLSLPPHALKLMIIHKNVPCVLDLESSHLWPVMKEEKRNQERRRRQPARWNKARTCVLVWSVIYLNLLCDSRTGIVCVRVCERVCTVSMCSRLFRRYVNVFVCVRRSGEIPLAFPFIRQRLSFFVWGDTRPTWIYLQRNLYELRWTCLDRQLQAAQQRASIKTLLNCINKCGEAKGDRQRRP